MQEPDRRGRRVGKHSVCRHHRPGARRDLRGGHPVDAQQLEGGGGADHVDHRVVSADLVEVHVLGAPAVQAALDVGEQPEGPQRPIGDPLG